MLHPSWSKKKMGFTATTYVPTACRYICISVHLAHRPSSRILHKCTGGVKCKKVPTRYIHIVFVTVLRLLHFCHTESLLQNWERIIYGNSLRTNYILFRTQFTKIPGAMNVTFFSSDSQITDTTRTGPRSKYFLEIWLHLLETMFRVLWGFYNRPAPIYYTEDPSAHSKMKLILDIAAHDTIHSFWCTYTGAEKTLTV